MATPASPPRRERKTTRRASEPAASGPPVLAKHRKLSNAEVKAHVQQAFDAEREIKAAAGDVHAAWWTLAERLYHFHEAGYWGALGYETLEDFLGQPDLGISRSQFFQMTKLVRDLHVVKQIPAAKLAAVESSKLREVTPAIMRGDVKPEDAIDDAQSLSFSDLKTKYRKEHQDRHGQKADDSTPLAAEDEPVLIQCEACGSWYPTPEEEDDNA